MRVETLGPLRVFAGDRELVLGTPKQRAVFAVLVLNADRVIARDTLIDHVWGRSAPSTAAGNLHTYVSGLRRLLSETGEPVTSSGSGYLFRSAAAQVDVATVGRLAERARALRARGGAREAVAALDEALAHWRPGAALAGLPGPYVAEHRVWAADLLLRLSIDRAELLLGLDRAAEAVAQLRLHVAANPYHERLRGLLMTALHHSGQTAEALTLFHDLRRLLAEDLGIDPSAELRALHSSILAEDGADAAVPVGLTAGVPMAGALRPAQLPRGVGGFVGRVDSVRQVVDAAKAVSTDGGAPACPRIVMIVGVGGVGKTVLALHCAQLLADDYPDGQLYLNLRGFDPKQPACSPADALSHLLASSGVRIIPEDHDERVALWRSAVRDKSMLLVLDNAASADQVEDLLPGGGRSQVIVTSRNRLSGLAVRYSARRVTLSPFTPGESLDLLRDAIGAEQVAAEPAAAARLAELCDHLPLALRIAAEQLTAGSPGAPPRIADVVAGLEDVQRRLDGLQVPDDDLYSVRGVLSWSYARLDSPAAHAFRMLGLVPGTSIRPEAAAALLDVTPPQATAVLRTLAGQHLVESAGGSHRMHDLTRIYAEEAARTGTTASARRQAVERLLDWYVTTLAQAYESSRGRLPFVLDAAPGHRPVSFADHRDLVAWCAQEWDNIAPLVRTAQRTGRHDRAWQLTFLLFDHFHSVGLPRDWIETLRLGMHSAETVGDRRAQAMLLDHMGVAHSRVGQHTSAVYRLQRGLQLLEGLSADAIRISLLKDLASTLGEVEDYATAVPYGRQALELAERLGADYSLAECLDVLTQLYAEMGDFPGAVHHGRLGLAAARRCRSVPRQAGFLINLGVAERGLGHPESALRYFHDALALSESSGDRYHEGLALFGLARANQGATARALADRASARLRDLDAKEAGAVEAFIKTLSLERPAAAR